MALSQIRAGSNAELLVTHYDNVFLERYKYVILADKYADKKTIPLWNGRVVDYFRYLPFATDTSTIPEGSSTANGLTLIGQNVQATVAKYGQYITYTETIKLVGRDKNLQGVVELMGEVAANTIDELLLTEICQNGSIPIRVDELDNSSTASVEGIADNSAGASTTVIYDSQTMHAGMTNANANVGHLGATATQLKGANTRSKNYGHGSLVSDWNDTSNTFTLSNAAPVAFTTAAKGAGCSYRYVSTTGLLATDLLTESAIQFALGKAWSNGFWLFDNGYYMGIIGNGPAADLMKSSTVFKNIGYYQRAAQFEKYELGPLWGVKWMRTTNPYREDVDTTKNMASGVVHSTLILGRHAYANIALAGMREKRVQIKTPGPQTVTEPYDNNGTISWHLYAAPKSLNAGFAINILSGSASS